MSHVIPVCLIQRRAFFKKVYRTETHKEEIGMGKHVACLNKCRVKSIVQSPLGGSHLSKVVTLHAICSRLFGRVLEVAVEKVLVIAVHGNRYRRKTYAMRSLRSLAFFRPPNAILVPGMYFLGFSRYSKRVSSFHSIPFCLLASV
jgi:hypothetical protein